MSWTQRGRLYILFPLATCNLRRYMKTHPCLSHNITKDRRFVMQCDMPFRRPQLDSRFVDWFFGQLVGIGEAVEHIHRLGFGCNIKLENMLIFEDDESAYGTIKISDLILDRYEMVRVERRGRIQVGREGPKAGTYDYASLNAYLIGRANFSSNMRSLGCVILEMLLWIFNPTPDGGCWFATEWTQPRLGKPDITDGPLWYSKWTQWKRTFVLTHAAQMKLSLLKEEYCNGRGRLPKCRFCNQAARQYRSDANDASRPRRRSSQHCSTGQVRS